MNISVLGAGNGGTAVAAELSLRGHNVTLIKTSRTMHDKNFEYLLNNEATVRLFENGETKTAKINHITRDISKISESEIIIIYIQTTYHEELIKRIKPYLKDGQILLNRIFLYSICP